MLALLAQTTFGAQAQCALDRIDEWGESRYVFDGDTLRLDDGRRVRLLGIDAPETAHEGRAAEALGDAAKSALAELAPRGTRLGLRLEAERRDRYGRWLAHLVLGDGTNLQAELLRRGLATTLVIPPNEWAHECYAKVQSHARREKRGLWGLARFQPVDVETLPAGTRGYRIVRGRVQRIGVSSGNVWLNFDQRVALRIPRSALRNFPNLDIEALRGRHIEARGRLEPRKRRLRMTVRHPSALTILD